MIFNNLKKKLSQYKAKRIFREYEYKVVEFDPPALGTIKYAQWLNPLERPKMITVSKVDFFKKFIKPGDMAIDIGAHTGDTPLPMALAAGPGGKVLALEPNPYIYKILEVNSTLNREKATIVPLCFAATATDGDFFYNSSEASFNNGGVSSEKTDRHGKFSLEAKVKGINLENYLRKNYVADLAKLALIKIDTEGHDKEVLNTLEGIIRDYRPALIFECFEKLTAEERHDLFESVAKHKYSLFHFNDFLADTEITEIIKSDNMMNWKHFDIYALPNK